MTKLRLLEQAASYFNLRNAKWEMIARGVLPG
jgi:hypothetical protein